MKLKNTTGQKYISENSKGLFDVRIPTLTIDKQDTVSKIYGKDIKTLEEAIEIRDEVLDILRDGGLLKEREKTTSDIESAKAIAQAVVANSGIRTPVKREKK